MIVQDVAGKQSEIFPAHLEHAYILLQIEEGRSLGGIWLRQHDDFPKTQGIIMELPRNREFLDKHYPEGLNVGDRVIFARYAHSEGHVIDSWAWEPNEIASGDELMRELSRPTQNEWVFTRRAIYAVHILDIEAIIGALLPALPQMGER